MIGSHTGSERDRSAIRSVLGDASASTSNWAMAGPGVLLRGATA